MALMRVDGVGAPMDYKKALMWLELAGKPSDVSYQLLINGSHRLRSRYTFKQCTVKPMRYVDDVDDVCVRA